MTEAEKLSDRVKKVMDRFGLSQTDVARELYITPSFVSKIVKGERDKLSWEKMERLDVLESRGPARRNPPQSQPQSQEVGGARRALKTAREAAGLSYAELAKRINRDAAYVRALESSAPISERTADLLVRELPALDRAELLGGSDTPPILSPVESTYGGQVPIDAPGMSVRMVPMISMAQAGALQAWTDDVYSHEAAPAFDLKKGRAFALKIKGDSMEPRYREGDTAILLPDEEPRQGGLVVARLADGDVLFKVFHGKKDEVTLTSYNPVHPVLHIPRRDFSWIYPVFSVTQKTWE